MKLYVTKPSPYARKAWSAVFELGLKERVEIIELPARMPTVDKPDLDAVNPLGKVPALITNAGELVCDSPVILAYLDAMAGGGRLIPSTDERWRVLTLEALADGCMDAGVVVRIETLKEDAQRSQAEIDAYLAKIHRSLDLIESAPRWLQPHIDAGAIALICAIDWLRFREIVADPLEGRPHLAGWYKAIADRPSLAATRPQ